MNNPVLISESFERAVGSFEHSVECLRRVGLDETVGNFARHVEVWVDVQAKVAELEVHKAHDLKIWAQIQAKLVVVEGMKAHNQWCLLVGNSQIYAESGFNLIAAEIEVLSHELAE